MQPSSPSYPANSADPRTSAILNKTPAVRQLEDEVLQSAEEAVLAEAGATKSGAGPKNPENGSASRAAPETMGARPLQSLASRYEDAVRRYVAAQPCRSALLAAVAGALATLVLRPVWRRGRRVVKRDDRMR